MGWRFWRKAKRVTEPRRETAVVERKAETGIERHWREEAEAERYERMKWFYEAARNTQPPQPVVGWQMLEQMRHSPRRSVGILEGLFGGLGF